MATDIDGEQGKRPIISAFSVQRWLSVRHEPSMAVNRINTVQGRLMAGISGGSH